MTLHDVLMEIAHKEHISGRTGDFATMMVPYFEAFGRAVHQKTRADAGYFDVEGAEDKAIIAGMQALWRYRETER